MAKLVSVLGAFSGKIGNLSYYYCRGQLCVRRRPVGRRLARSQNQKLWQNRFGTCVTFYYSLNWEHVKPIWGILGKLMGVSGLSAFISSNIQAFDGNSGIGNYEQIHFSCGGGKMPMGFEILWKRGNRVEVRWDTGWSTSLDSDTDRLRAGVIYDDEPSRPCLAENVTGTRSAGVGTIELREGYAGRCHLYCYFMSEDGRCYSDDKYFRL